MKNPPKTKPGPKAKVAGDLTPAERLDDLGIDAICEMIEDGDSLRQIAATLGMRHWSLQLWLTHGDRKARADASRIVSAETEDDLALKAIQGIPQQASAGDIAKAREEASHRRWRASKRDPRGYGERVQVDGTLDVRTADTEALRAEALTLIGGLKGSPQAG